MTNQKIYQICHNLITYFVTLTSPKKSHLGLIFRTGGSNIEDYKRQCDGLAYTHQQLIIVYFRSHH